MRHKFPVLTVKKLLKSVSIYGSYHKNKTGVPFFWNTLYGAATASVADAVSLLRNVNNSGSDPEVVSALCHSVTVCLRVIR